LHNKATPPATRLRLVSSFSIISHDLLLISSWIPQKLN
jgi:hypothetical protein